MARPMKPLVRSGGYYPSRKWIPLVYQGGYTTANGGEQPEPEAVLKTVTGSLIHITDALALPAKALTVNVEPIQDLHGQASPYPAGGGPNKLPPLTSETKNGVTITVADDGTVTINGEATTDSYFDCNFTTSWLSGDTYYFCAFNPVASTSNRLSIFVITDNGNPQINLNTANAVFSTQASANQTTSRWRLRVPAGVTFSNFIVKPMFQVGGTAPTAYAPYSNICPISGRTSATVTRTGKNLLDPSERTVTAYNIRYYDQTGLRLVPGTYTISISETLNGLYVIDKGSGTTIFTKYTSDFLTFTLTEVKSVEFNFYKTSGISADTLCQLEVGSTATAYEPYAGNTYTIQLGDTVYGGTLDVTGGKMVVDSVKNSFIWGNGIGLTNIGSVTRKLFALSAPSINAVEGKNRCSIAPFLYNYTSDTVHFYCNATYALVFLPNDTPTDTEFEVVANLATSIEITLTPTQIDMLLGTNNLWSDAGDSTLTYYAEGEASTSEALGILLGGTYNNPGGADDVSDDEALGILLGGS